MDERSGHEQEAAERRAADDLASLVPPAILAVLGHRERAPRRLAKRRDEGLRDVHDRKAGRDCFGAAGVYDGYRTQGRPPAEIFRRAIREVSS